MTADNSRTSNQSAGKIKVMCDDNVRNPTGHNSMFALWPGDQLNFSIFIKPTFGFAGQPAASKAGHIANTNVVGNWAREFRPKNRMTGESRQVGFKTILALLKQRRMNLSVGLIFTLLPFAIGGMFLLIISLIDSEIPDADYESISSSGMLTTATITDIETQSNITVNNEHPSIISYKYFKGDIEVDGIYRSLDPDKINRMDIGDTILVKYLADSSMIVGLEPFKFPFDILFNILISFLVIGLFMLGLLYLRIRNELNLYKHGQVKDAELISMTPKSGLPISGLDKE